MMKLSKDDLLSIRGVLQSLESVEGATVGKVTVAGHDLWVEKDGGEYVLRGADMTARPEPKPATRTVGSGIR